MSVLVKAKDNVLIIDWVESGREIYKLSAFTVHKKVLLSLLIKNIESLELDEYPLKKMLKEGLLGIYGSDINIWFSVSL